MLIGFILGAIVGLVFVIWTHARTQNYVLRFNDNSINRAMGRKATYHFNRGLALMVAAVPALIGAAIGYFLGA
jgi:hypothetical protein